MLLHAIIFQVSQNGLDIVGLLIERLGSSFRPYLNVVLAAVIDRLGDARETVREKANAVLVKVMDEVVEPQQLFDKLVHSFSHKNGKVREELLLLTRFTLNT
jgi:CLIP-associating protein 1/2